MHHLTGHGKRSPHAAKPLPIPLADRDVDLDAGDPADPGDAVQDPDDVEVEAAAAAARAETGADSVGYQRRGYQRYQVVGSVLPAHLADLISEPREPVVQDTDPADESEELMHRIRSQNRRRVKSRDNDFQVLIIPNEEPQVPDYHIYQILGRASRKRT
ncbi:Malate dehydrogenase [Frankliniella fusca]|uniref:Malate dehydrogenase n=1 Tax=Frankliniella fusca TaxID=407009 RepID=A0AAE1LQA3_9NEOP|nr:Malate dehydrogenase [Frankliniella fusca]